MWINFKEWWLEAKTIARKRTSCYKKGGFPMSSVFSIFHWRQHMLTVNNPLQSSRGKQPTICDFTTKKPVLARNVGCFLKLPSIQPKGQKKDRESTRRARHGKGWGLSKTIDGNHKNVRWWQLTILIRASKSASVSSGRLASYNETYITKTTSIQQYSQERKR